MQLKLIVHPWRFCSVMEGMGREHIDGAGGIGMFSDLVFVCCLYNQLRIT